MLMTFFQSYMARPNTDLYTVGEHKERDVVPSPAQLRGNFNGVNLAHKRAEGREQVGLCSQKT